MHTLGRQIMRMLPFFLLSASIAAVNPVMAETDGAAEHSGHVKRDWPGIYNGFLPCADCVGIKTSLALNKNGSYVLITQNVGKSPRDFVEKGKYAWDDNTDTLVLTPRKGKGDKIHQYAVDDNALIQLDEHGNRHTGKLADNYILQRNDVTSEPPEHSGH
ncbi:copper resistance protein NlpE [Methylomonas sp. MgM2]